MPSTLEAEDIHTDILCEILLNKKQALMHIEFQKKRDGKMGKRLWDYNVRATLKYDWPVWSYVIYLTPDSAVEAFYSRTFPDGRTIHNFHFSVIKLWEIPTQELLKAGLSELAPLLVLTREGQHREVVETAIELLDPPEGERKDELLVLAYGLASLILTNEADQEWLAWRFGMLYEILKDTRAFRDLAKMGLDEGLRQGIQQGLQQAQVQALENERADVLKIIEARFVDPVLVEQARVQVAGIGDLEMLRDVLVKVALLQKPEEVVPLLKQFAPAESRPVLEQHSQTRSASVRKRATSTRKPRKKAE